MSGQPLTPASSEKYGEINLSELLPDSEYRYRSELNVDDLARSIMEVGQQVPIIVLEADDGKYQLISGFRRCAALRKNKIKTAKAIIHREMSDRQAIQISLLENIERQSLNVWDQVLTATRFRSEGLKNREIAELFGTSIRTIQRYFAASKAPKVFQDALIRDEITLIQCVEALSKNISLQELVGKGRSVRYLRNLSKNKRGKKDTTSANLKRGARGELKFSLNYSPDSHDDLPVVIDQLKQLLQELQQTNKTTK